jgi:hypothetical protein
VSGGSNGTPTKRTTRRHTDDDDNDSKAKHDSGDDARRGICMHTSNALLLMDDMRVGKETGDKDKLHDGGDDTRKGKPRRASRGPRGIEGGVGEKAKSPKCVRWLLCVRLDVR